MTRRTSVVLLLWLAVSPTLLSAQRPASGQLDGVVVDATSSVLVNAEVTLVDRATGDHRQLRTDAAGAFHVEGLRDGAYDLAVTAPGFARWAQTISITADSNRSLRLLLQPDALLESVTVQLTTQDDPHPLRLAAAGHELPMAVTTYTATLFDAVAARRTDDLFSYMTGVSRADNTAYDVTIRGIRAREPNNLLVDGLPGLVSRFGSPTLADVERIELLRGPASVHFGQVQPGGVLNLITKKPTETPTRALGIRWGAQQVSGDVPTVARLDGDLGGRLVPSGRWRYRLMSSIDVNESFRRAVNDRDVFVSPAVRWVPTSATTVDVAGAFRHERTRYDDGLVAPNNDIRKVADFRTRYQEPGDTLRETGASLTATAVHRRSERTTWTAMWRSVLHDDERREYENVAVAKDGVTLQRRDREQRNHRAYHTVDAHASMVRQMLGRTHSLVVGSTLGYELRAPEQVSATASPTLNINLYAPVYGAPRPATTAGTFRQDVFYNTALYAQDLVRLRDGVSLLAAVRQDAQTAVYDDQRSTDGRTTRPHAWSPTAGVVVGRGRRWNSYANVSTSWVPANPEAQDATGQNSFVPERGRQVEVGSRLTTANDRIDLRVATYRIVRDHVLQTLGGSVTTQLGQERSDGLEFDGRLRIGGGLDLVTGYAWTDARVTADGAAVNIGARVPNVPRHSAHAWARYGAREGRWRPLAVGLGVIYRDVRAGSLPLPTLAALQLPAYTRLDATATYRAAHADITLQTTNLTNRRYFESARSAIGIMPGAPRQVIVSLRTRR